MRAYDCTVLLCATTMILASVSSRGRRTLLAALRLSLVWSHVERLSYEQR